MTIRAEKTKKSTSPKSGASKKPVAPSKRRAKGKGAKVSAAEKTPKTIGRPTHFSDELMEKAALEATFGHTNEQIAKTLGIAVSTFQKYIAENKSFSEAIRRGKQIADARVVASLYERACGYSHPDVHIAVDKGEVIVTPLIKHYPPETGAIKTWLFNRRSDEWAEKIEHTHKLVDMTDEELDAELAKVRAAVSVGSQ